MKLFNLFILLLILIPKDILTFRFSRKPIGHTISMKASSEGGGSVFTSAKVISNDHGHHSDINNFHTKIDDFINIQGQSSENCNI
jgi:hypothetical protein